MEEQRARQEDEARRATAASTTGDQRGIAAGNDSTEDVLLKQALELSMQTEALETNKQSSTQPRQVVDFDAMSEEQQIAYAMQMSLQASASGKIDGE